VGRRAAIEQQPGLVGRRSPAGQLDAEVLEDRGARSTRVQRVGAQVADRAVADGGAGATTEPAAALEQGDGDPLPRELAGRE
jgi:hypothetical protein